jgi:hypothetical protein
MGNMLQQRFKASLVLANPNGFFMPLVMLQYQ